MAARNAQLSAPLQVATTQLHLRFEYSSVCTDPSSISDEGKALPLDQNFLGVQSIQLPIIRIALWIEVTELCQERTGHYLA